MTFSIRRSQPGDAPAIWSPQPTSRSVASAGLHAAGAPIRRRHAVSLGLSVARQAQLQGIGTALLAALTDYADNWGHVLRIELTVYTDNHQAIKLYRTTR